MKRKLIIGLLVLSSFFIFACGLTDMVFNRIGENTSSQSEEIVSTEPNESESQEENYAPEDGDSESAIQINTQSPCYHPFFPVEDGAWWTYAYASGEGYTISIEETGEDTFTMTQIMSDEETEFTADWYCSEDGLLRGSFAQVDLLNQVSTDEDAPEMVFETLLWEGETLPAPELMDTGYTWTSNYSLSADINLESFTQTMEVEVSIDHEIGAIEEVTVPAGTFPQAYRVDSTGNIEMIMILGETSNPMSGFEFNFSTWYVEGVGMVKSSSTFSSMDSQVELTESSLLN